MVTENVTKVDRFDQIVETDESLFGNKKNKYGRT